MEQVKRLLYVVGEPAAGKTTLMRRIIEKLAADESSLLDCSTLAPLVKGHRIASDFFLDRYVLGNYDDSRGLFAGTDALSMAVMPKAIALLSEQPAIYLGEGDRLGSIKFFRSAKDDGYDVRVVWLRASEETLSARQDERGNKQSETFLKGRKTKVERLAADWDIWVEASAEDQASLDAAVKLSVEFLSVPRG